MDQFDNMSEEQINQLVAQKLASQSPQQGDQFDNMSEDEINRLVAEKLSTSQPSREGEAALQGFGQGATLGYLPQAQAVGEMITSKLAGLFTETPEEVNQKLADQGFSVPQEGYTESRDYFANRGKELERQNPKSYLAGQVGGALAGGIATGGGGGTGLANVAKTGATMGFLQNPGDVEGELSPVQLEERLKGAAMGAVIGSATYAGGKAVKAVYDKIRNSPTALKSFAELSSLKSSGAMLKDFRKAFGNKRANDLGREIIDSGIISAGDDVSDIAKKAYIAKKVAGEEIGDILARTDEAVMKLDVGKLSPKRLSELSDSTIDLAKFSSNFKKELKNKLTGKAGGTKIFKQVAKELDAIAENGSDVPLKRLAEVRNSVEDLIDYSKSNLEMPAVQRELSNIRNRLQEMAKNRVMAIDKVTGNGDITKLISANKRYGNMAEVFKMANDKAAREASNSAFGLRERISGGVGATVGGMVAGVPGAVVGGTLGSITTKVARKYGTPVAATMADKAARILESNPSLLGKFAEPLINAASENPKTFVKIIQRLRSDPDFIKVIKEKK